MQELPRQGHAKDIEQNDSLQKIAEALFTEDLDKILAFKDQSCLPHTSGSLEKGSLENGRMEVDNTHDSHSKDITSEGHDRVSGLGTKKTTALHGNETSESGIMVASKQPDGVKSLEKSEESTHGDSAGNLGKNKNQTTAHSE